MTATEFRRFVTDPRTAGRLSSMREANRQLDAELASGNCLTDSQVRSIGWNVRRIRQRRGISQKALAVSMGMHQSVLCDIERTSRLVETPTLLKLACGLRCSVEALIVGVDPEYDAMYRARVGRVIWALTTELLPTDTGSLYALVEANRQLDAQLAAEEQAVRS